MEEFNINHQQKPEVEEEPRPKGLWKRLRYWWRKPSKMALGSLIIIGVAIGICGLVGFNYGLNKLDSEAFCLSCHEMSNNIYEEYLTSTHFANKTGIKVSCPDCHIPHSLGGKLLHKVGLVREVIGTWRGKIDTKDKFEAHRLEMAKREWARLDSNDSQECRGCHNFNHMDFSAQSAISDNMHNQAIANGQTCIECHKGIAHKLPDMKNVKGGF